jgi:hypothetical protein
MSFVWVSDPKFVAPYRSNDIQESCVLALDYFSGLVDQFIAKLQEHRRQQDFHDWLADEHTLPEKIHLIFPNGYGDYDEDNNHNPHVWPYLIELSNAVHGGTTEEFANELCEVCEDTYNADRQCTDQIQLLQRIFDNFTYFLHMFVTYADEESLRPDFSPHLDFDQWWTEMNQRMAKRHYG